MIEEKVNDLKRVDEVTKILLKEEAGFILDKLDLEDRIPFHQKIGLNRKTKPSPERLRETIEELGTTFIKFGQILAQRPDIVPQKYIDELEKLEDSAPEFSYDKAEEIIKKEIGTDQFKNIEEEPLAAASIAQVHRATLQNGEEVIIKIRRPGIKKQVETDLEIVEYLATKLEKHFTKAKTLQLQKVVHEFARWTKQELDLKREQENADLFRENLSDEEKLRAPETYPEHTTEKVLVMEYVEGVKCTEQEKLREMDIENEEIAKTIVRGVLKQSIRDGFFHADPHPSNFLIEEDSTVVYLDFGMMGKMTKRNRDLLGLLLLHAVNGDVESGLQTVKQMGYVEDDAQLEELKGVIEDKLVKINHNTIRETSISKELLDLSVEASKRGVHMPSSLTLVGKSLLTMEGIGLTIYPEFQLDDEYKRVTEKLLAENNKPKDLGKTLAIDIIQNKDLITKLPTKLNNQLDQGKQTIKIEQEKPENPVKGKHIISATLIFTAAFLTQNQLNPDQKIIAASVALAIATILFLKK